MYNGMTPAADQQYVDAPDVLDTTPPLTAHIDNSQQPPALGQEVAHTVPVPTFTSTNANNLLVQNSTAPSNSNANPTQDLKRKR